MNEMLLKNRRSIIFINNVYFLLFKLYLAIEGIRQFIWLEKQLENIEDEELEESIIKISNSLNKIIDEKSIEILGK